MLPVCERVPNPAGNRARQHLPQDQRPQPPPGLLVAAFLAVWIQAAVQSPFHCVLRGTPDCISACRSESLTQFSRRFLGFCELGFLLSPGTQGQGKGLALSQSTQGLARLLGWLLLLGPHPWTLPQLFAPTPSLTLTCCSVCDSHLPPPRHSLPPPHFPSSHCHWVDANTWSRPPGSGAASGGWRVSDPPW